MKYRTLSLRTLPDIFFICRPVVLIPVWGFSLLGFLRCRELAGVGVPLFSTHSVSFTQWGGMAFFSCAVAAVYVVNQLADRATDSQNPGFSLLEHGAVSVGVAWAAIGICVAGALAGPILVGMRALVAPGAAALVLGVVYSVKPLRLSGRPVADFCSNALGYGLVAFAAGWICAGGGALDSRLWSAAAPYVLLMAAGSISSTIPDIAGDRASGKITTAVWLGRGRAHVLATVMLPIALGVALVQHDKVGIVCAAVALAVYLFHCSARSEWSLESTYKVGGGFMMVVVGVYFPVFAAVSIIVVLLTMAYFRIFFSVRYPSLLPAVKIHA